jgi:hypothetical protein
LHALRAGSEVLPRPKDGVTLDAALARLADALSAHGSPSLRAALDRHREALVAAVRGSATLEDVLGKLRIAALSETESTVQ